MSEDQVKHNEAFVDNSDEISTDDMPLKKPAKRRAAKSYLDVAKKTSKPSKGRSVVIKSIKSKEKMKKNTTKSSQSQAGKVVDQAFQNVEAKIEMQMKKVSEDLIAASLEKEFQHEEAIYDEYGICFVSLIPRDPFHIFAYWEIDSAAIDRARKEVGECFDQGVYTLRIYDVTLVDFNGINANEWFDLDGLHMKSRHIKVRNDNASYCAEIGLRFVDGHFQSFYRSNIVQTPRYSPSVRSEMIYKEIKHDIDAMPYALIAQKKQDIKDQALFRKSWQMNAKKISLTIDDIRSYYANGKGIKEIVSDKTVYVQGGKKYVLSPTGEKIFIDQEGEDIVLSEHVEEKYWAQHFIGSSDSLVTPCVERDKRTDFPFSLETELVVKGRTEPGAKVLWGGKEIKLEADGSFYLKLVLQDGVVPLEFQAISKDQLGKKKITTSVIRTKTVKDFN